MLLQDKIILITGIGPGLGAQLVQLAAAEGAKAVIQVSRSQIKMSNVEKIIKTSYPSTEILNIVCDISDQQACQHTIDQVYKKFSHLDALINNAYAHHVFEPIDKSDISTWQKVFNVNLFGSMYLSQAAILNMKKHGNASVVMISSMASRSINAGEAAYACSKSALNTAAAYLAKEVGHHGIRVNTLAPGWMWGASVKYHFQEMQNKNMGTIESLKKNIEKDIPLGNMPTDTDCAKAALFLASDYAKAVNGVCLDANGGHFIAL